MTQAKPRFRTFEEYLDYDDESDRRYELINGELFELPPESPENDFFALNLRDLLIKVVRRQLVRVHTCEMQVRVLEPKDPANRYPDLVILRPEHLEIMQRRLTINSDMPPPQLVAEVVSPGKKNREHLRCAKGVRDLIRKRDQYAARGIPEYWLIDPSRSVVVVLTLKGDFYQEQSFTGNVAIVSPTFPDLQLTAEQVLRAGDDV